MSRLRTYLAAGILLSLLSTSRPGRVQAEAPPPCPWSGVYPTVITPFCASGGVDVAALEHEVRYQLQGGVTGLLLLGSFGEGQYVSIEERAQTVATAVRVAGPQVPVIVGIHTCNLQAAVAEMQQAKELGAAAVLIKYLGNPKASASEVIAFYQALCDLHILPIFYYHFPDQTGLKLKPEAIAAIASLPGVVGIKESTLDLPEMQQHIRLTCSLGKVVMTSTALNLTQFLDMGGQGAMCPEAAFLPGPTMHVYTAYVEGRHDEARALQKELYALTPVLRTRRTTPALSRAIGMAAADHAMKLPTRSDHPQAQLKAAFNCLGVPMATTVKCPLPPLTAREQKRVQKAMEQIQEIDWAGVVLHVPPVPRNSDLAGPTGHMLLRTGAIQLGAGVEKNLWRWQGDGESGF